MEKLILDTLHNLQRITQANFLTFHLRAEESFNPIIPAIEVSWEGNTPGGKLDSVVELKLIEQAASTGQIACLEPHSGGQIDPTFHAAMVLPIVLDRFFAGSVTLVWECSVAPTFDLPMTQALVQLTGLALHNARHQDSQQYYIQALEYVGKLSTELNVLPNHAAVVHQVGQTAAALLNAERSILLLTRDNRVEQSYAEGIPTELVEAIKDDDLPEHVLPVLFGIENTLVVSQDDGKPVPSTWREIFQAGAIQSGMISLLRSHDRIFGSLWILYSRHYQPTPYDTELIEILAAQAAVALENIELMADNVEHQHILEDKVAERTMELAVALDKAEDADRLKTQLLSTVSHELRTPLAVIKAHISTLINYYDRLPKERHVQYLNIAHGETDRLTSMINGLLDMSRLDAGRLDIRSTPIEPLKLLARFIDLFQTRYPDRLFTLVTPPELNQALGDSERVWQVLSNLVDNAAKYSPPGTPIEIGARAWEDNLELWVKDGGDGLTPEQIRRVFDRFYQVENLNRVGTRSGVGLGLAICKGLIEEMGGRIWCESRGSGLGSKFAFTLPWFKEG